MDCMAWLRQADENSVEAVLTDPPYGLVEYTELEKQKLRDGKGGVWRIPPSFDGSKRSPLPRFTTLTPQDLENMHRFFRELGILLARVVVPGGNIVVASNPLLAHIVASAMAEGGLEMRGTITRLVMTMRGGDRPKNAHEEAARWPRPGQPETLGNGGLPSHLCGTTLRRRDTIGADFCDGEESCAAPLAQAARTPSPISARMPPTREGQDPRSVRRIRLNTRRMQRDRI